MVQKMITGTQIDEYLGGGGVNDLTFPTAKGQLSLLRFIHFFSLTAFPKIFIFCDYPHIF